MKFKKPKKSLGQNFLVDKNIINLIINTGDINQNDTVVEVGPGTGNLTESIILKNPKKIFVIEKDTYLSNQLNEKFKEKITVINNDILKIDERKLSNKPIIVFGNLPYNISTQILVKWIRLNNFEKYFKKLILMFQKEVAERIISETNKKNYGRLSILTYWKMNVKKIADISPNSFYPVPKVKSTLLMFEPKINLFEIKNPKNLEHVKNIFFNQRRKMIKKPLKLLFNNNLKKISDKLNIDINERPQNLSPLKYFEICKEFEKLTP